MGELGAGRAALQGSVEGISGKSDDRIDMLVAPC